MSTKHTPGPWKLLSPDQVRGPEGEWICSCEGGRHRAKKDAANAALIALAPEMARIIAALAEWSDAGSLPRPTSLMPDSETETFEDAIKKVNASLQNT